ncbi:MAG: ATP-binding cassette domain-containing protein [Pseudonocardiaceae bacterium]
MPLTPRSPRRSTGRWWAEFVPELPDGLDTVVGERGATLSGGQRQRIAIARALLKNAPILIMDEAVSNLDTENEQALHAAMAEVRRGRTTLLIAHRLSTIRGVDLIVTLDNGRVAEAGHYDELVRAGGTCSRLIAAQHHGRLD